MTTGNQVAKKGKKRGTVAEPERWLSPPSKKQRQTKSVAKIMRPDASELEEVLGARKKSKGPPISSSDEDEEEVLKAEHKPSPSNAKGKEKQSPKIIKVS